MVDNATEPQVIDVGIRLRQLRIERGMSMRAVARRSGLSTNALSMIERSRTSPSVSTLTKISEALHIPITAFFRVEPPRQDIVFRKAQDKHRIVFPQGYWEGLGGELFTGRVEPFLLSLEPNGCSGPYGMIHSGHEFVFCLSGSIEYQINDQFFTLNAGDSLIFAAHKRHRWCNVGQVVAEAIIVLAGFDVDESPSEHHISSGLKGVSHETDIFELDVEDESPEPGNDEV
jgi:transcriptional regulator with XRE-family HTH domain